MIFTILRPFLGLVLGGKLRTRALIVHRGRVLLLRNWIGSQRWTLPGGGLRSGEEPKQGLRRELNEELGLDLDATSFRQILKTNQQETSLNFPVIIFEINIQKAVEFTINHPEIIQAKWFEISELPQNLHPVVVRALSARKK